MSKDWYQDIVDFHKALDHLVNTYPCYPPTDVIALRERLIKEEVNDELLPAIQNGNLVKIADGIADAIVVLLGTAISYGIDLRPIWDEVHRSNMAKVGGGKDEGGKSLKPRGWMPPDILGLLIKQTKNSNQ
jgi:predicted HAD superfamily Cof-like phosphohydrolase